MLEFYVSNQTLRMYTPVIAADTLHFLTGKVNFTDDVWDGYTKTIHFTDGQGLGSTVYDILLADGAFGESAELNLTAGEWQAYLTGAKDEARITSSVVVFTVQPSGLIDAPLHVMPLSIAEQIGTQASTALSYAAAVRAAAEAGEFNGADGRSFVIAGFYDTAEDLAEAVTNPDVGAAYGVGIDAPYDIYIWDDAHSEWVNNGPLQGAKGDPGDDGTTFLPSVDMSGNISWTNDGGKTSPTTRNIKGPKGDKGDKGDDGKGPYEYAVEQGYTGTLDSFNQAITIIGSHASRHLPGGGDTITVKTANIENNAVESDKIRRGAVSSLKIGTITTTWDSTISSDKQLLSPDGEETEFAIVALPSSVTQVKVLSSGTILVGGTDYTYDSTTGVLTFTPAPASGTDAIEVTYPVSLHSQTISVAGLSADDNVLVDVNLSGKTISEIESILDDFSRVYRIAIAAGELTVYSFDETSTAIPITIMVVSK